MSDSTPKEKQLENAIYELCQILLEAGCAGWVVERLEALQLQMNSKRYKKEKEEQLRREMTTAPVPARGNW